MKFHSNFGTIEDFLAKFTSPEPWDKSYRDMVSFRYDDMYYSLSIWQLGGSGGQFSLRYRVISYSTKTDEDYHAVCNNAPKDWFYDDEDFPFPVFGLAKPSLVKKTAIEFIQNKGHMPTCVEWVKMKSPPWPDVNTWCTDREIEIPILPTRAYKL